MKTRVIRINIQQERELYETPLSATMNPTEYDGCYVMQYAEHRGEEGQVIGEFTLQEKETGGQEAAV